MRSLQKFFDTQIGEFLGIEDVFYHPEVTSWTLRGRWVDEDNYEIRPKPKYYETLINHKKEEIEALKRQKESDDLYYERRLKKLEEEKEKLLRERDNKP
jgi:hypothetical protein